MSVVNSKLGIAAVAAVAGALVGHLVTKTSTKAEESDAKTSKMHRIFVMGGATGMRGQGSLKSTESYNPQTNTWTPRADMNQPRRGAASVTFKNEIYMFGGFNGKNYLNTVEKYNPTADQWTYLSPMKHPRSCSSAVVNGNDIFVVGGWNGMDVLDVCEKYDVETDRWEDIANLKIPRKNCVGACLKFGDVQKVTVIGGWDESSTLRVVEIYDEKSGCWVRNDNFLTLPRECMASAVKDNMVYLYGGWNSDGLMDTVDVGRVKEKLIEWELAPELTLSVARECFSAICVDDEMFLVGGWFDGKASPWLERYSVGTAKWIKMAQMKESRNRPCAEVIEIPDEGQSPLL